MKAMLTVLKTTSPQEQLVASTPPSLVLCKPGCHHIQQAQPQGKENLSHPPEPFLDQFCLPLHCQPPRGRLVRGLVDLNGDALVAIEDLEGAQRRKKHVETTRTPPKNKKNKEKRKTWKECENIEIKR